MYIEQFLKKVDEVMRSLDEAKWHSRSKQYKIIE